MPPAASKKTPDVGVLTPGQVVCPWRADSTLRRSATVRCADRGARRLVLRPPLRTGGGRGGSPRRSALSCVSALDLHDFWVAPGYPGVHARGHAPQQPRGILSAPRLPIAPGNDRFTHSLWHAPRNVCVPKDWIAAGRFGAELTKQDDSRGTCAALDGLIDYDAIQLSREMRPGRRIRPKVDRESAPRSIYKVAVQPRIPGVGRSTSGRAPPIECDSRPTTWANGTTAGSLARPQGHVGRIPPIRLTYSTVFYDWEDAMADIVALTRKSRHRYGAQSC